PIGVCGARGTSFGIKITGKEAVVYDFESKIFVKGLTEDFTEMNDELLLTDGWKVNFGQFEKPSRVTALSAGESANWHLWLEELDAIPAEKAVDAPSLVNFAAINETLSHHNISLMSLVAKNAGSSISFVAFILYVALAVNVGRVFL
ncbi:MAG: hypothetical protein HQL28_07185, partial [Candidatus Omnitrophica bacterium]|nr:hypothetical protein [Candidatus Omnitrophota bacterium]